MARELNVTAADAGERLDTFLAGPLGSRARAQRLIDDGLVLVDGAPRPKRHRLRGGERIAVEEAEPPPQDDRSDAPYEVRYEDGDLLVVDKPAGVVVHPARGHRTGTLAQALAGRAAGGPEPWRAGIVHRLDRDTSGLLVVAKSEEAHRRLRALMKARRIEREYLALVEGRPPARTGTIDAPLGRDRRERKRISVDSDVPAHGGHAFRRRAGAARFDAPARAPGDGANAPDPRSPSGDRPPGGRRSPVRPPRPLRAGAPVPARRPSGLRPSDDRPARRRRVAAPSRPGGGSGESRHRALIAARAARPKPPRRAFASPPHRT